MENVSSRWCRACQLELLNLLVSSHVDCADSPELGIGPTFHVSRPEEILK